MELLRQRQLDLMLILSGICGSLTFFVFVTRAITARRKRALLYLELGSMLLLIADRYAYLYRGGETLLAFWMVRVSNFLVFFLTLFVMYGFNLYLMDLYTTDGKLGTIPTRLHIVTLLFVIGELLVIISQFTGFYYTFDETNHYQRSSGFIICYIIPLLILLLQLSVNIQLSKSLNGGIRISILLFTIVPLLASLIQIFAYGLSLTNITIACVAIMLYIFALFDMNRTVERATRLEIEMLKKEQKEMQLMFEQTAEALAGAIDAKDKYTHGHSTRVAEYSKKIAEIAGGSEKDCEEVYFAALLHDVGKIGIPDNIINKEGRLTDEEYAVIKTHPVIGRQILASISKSPYLSVGANYHHERYDGRGYPEGLRGDDIPAIARIIAVADAYDAMTSKRSYRDPLPQQIVREEFVKGMGIQFDPTYAGIMLRLIDLDTQYEMREQEEMESVIK